MQLMVRCITGVQRHGAVHKLVECGQVEGWLQPANRHGEAELGAVITSAHVHEACSMKHAT